MDGCVSPWTFLWQCSTPMCPVRILRCKILADHPSSRRVTGLSTSPTPAVFPDQLAPVDSYDQLRWIPTTFEKTGSVWSFHVSLFPLLACNSASCLFEVVWSLRSNLRLTYWLARLVVGGWTAYFFLVFFTYCMDASTHIYIQIYMHICTYTFSYAQRDMHMHTRIYIYIYI